MFNPIDPLPMDNHTYPLTYPAKNDICFDPYACRMKVEGTGIVKVLPDIITVSIGVSVENMQLTDAQAENARIMNDVLHTLTDAGVPLEDIQTQNYSVYPQYDYIDGRQELRGYRVTHNLLVTLREPKKAGEIIDASVQSGANEIGQLTFSVENPSIYNKQALELALDDAHQKAIALGHKMGVTVSPRPVYIIEERFSQSAPYGVLGVRSDSSTQIQTGQLEITATISVLYTY